MNLIVDGNTIGTLAVGGEALTFNDISYALAVSDGTLCLTVVDHSPETPSLVVTTASDAVDAYDHLTSLTEAITYAQSLGGLQTVSFNMPDGDTVTISDPELIYHDLRFASTNEATGNDVTVVLDNLSISNRSISTSESSSERGGSIFFANTGSFMVNGGEYTNNRDSGSGGRGGAIHVISGTLSVDGTRFSSNYAYNAGGAINVDDDSTLTVRNSIFDGNHTVGFAGAIDIFYSDAYIVDTTFTNNYTRTSSYYGWCGGAISLTSGHLIYEVSDGITITNVGNYSGIGGFISLSASDTSVEFRVNGTLTIGSGDGNDSIASKNDAENAFIRKTGTGTMTINAPTQDYNEAWIIEDGVLAFTYGGDFDGDITISGGQMQFAADYSFNKLTFALGEVNQVAYLNDITRLSGGSFFVEAGNAGNGTYKLAGNADSFDSDVTVVFGGETVGTLFVGESVMFNGVRYALRIADGVLSLTYDNAPTIVSGMTVDGTVSVLDGEIYSSTTVTATGNFHVSSGGAANETAVNAGRMYVSNGGVASGATLTSGQIHVLSDGELNHATVNAGSMFVSDGATVNDVTVNAGYAFISSGGVINGVEIASAGGYMYVSSGGVANDVSVTSGQIRVSSGGVASDVTVDSAGQARIYSGGKLTGRMQFEEGATIVTSSGAIIDFDISTVEPGAEARLNDLTRVPQMKNVNFTLTVSDTQAAGRYALAENASRFNKTITVQNTSGEALGTLIANDEPVFIGDMYYTLHLADGSLYLDYTPSLPSTGHIYVDPSYSDETTGLIHSITGEELVFGVNAFDTLVDGGTTTNVPVEGGTLFINDLDWNSLSIYNDGTYDMVLTNTRGNYLYAIPKMANQTVTRDITVTLEGGDYNHLVLLGRSSNVTLVGNLTFNANGVSLNSGSNHIMGAGESDDIDSLILGDITFSLTDTYVGGSFYVTCGSVGSIEQHCQVNGIFTRVNTDGAFRGVRSTGGQKV